MNAVEGTDWERLMIKPTLGIGFRPLVYQQDSISRYIHTLSGRNTPDTDSIELRMGSFSEGLMGDQLKRTGPPLLSQHSVRLAYSPLG
ncbi:hypothetical protein [Candidatus Reidiella endopervernicosa]|uniref:Uncharacterized protein n=1 Tax=Candidatus Reidiella endopervernicosa TaxID=2738883 RepID=A0A6N0HYD7_9GAMM|nr:hypothetical protein [Candidatus Reidiella endopervernicosa]QKQ27372.1 hypothetical protein HUE57_14605 [Candidatus Reidiella endopervernicosa]